MMNKSNKEHLKECLRNEVMMSEKDFSWLRTLHKAFKCPERRYIFWWRVASYLHSTSSKFRRSRAKSINRKLIKKYGCEIQLGAYIGPGIVISHHNGIVINGCAMIGSAFRVRQNTTIGIGGGTKPPTQKPRITIGDNVTVGAGTCIISNNISIGNNVEIGAMTFINKDVPNNCLVYSEKKMVITKK